MIQAHDLERQVIATMSHDKQSRDIYLSLLTKEHFADQQLARDFKTMQDGGDIGDYDIRDMMPANHEYNAAILDEYKSKRDIFRECTNLAHDARSDLPFDELIQKLEQLKAGIASASLARGLTISEIESRDADKQSFEQIRTGYDYGDFYNEAGCRKGQTEVVFGHPKHGKTVYAVHRVCGYLREGYKGLFITMEDTHTKIRKRVGEQLGFDHEHKEQMYIADRSLGVKHLDDVAKFCRYHSVADAIDFVVLDYIQRTPVQGLSAKDENAKVMEVSHRMTDLANELNLNVILLAQPHKMDKMRSGWEAFPQIYDLHGSSAIEKDAFVATAVFRPAMIDKLCNFTPDGRVTGVMDWNGNEVHRNSVYVKQRLNREAERSNQVLHFVHDDGLYDARQKPITPF